MTKIRTDKKNYRIHPDKNKELIKQSLENYGAGRSILADSEGIIIAGNGVFDEAKKLNIPVKIIESDGKELIIVQRTDLKTEDQKRKLLAIADNKTTDTSYFDLDLLEEEMQKIELELLGFEITEKDLNTPEEKELRYFKQSHILISFPLDLTTEVFEIIEKLQKIEGIEIETASN